VQIRAELIHHNIRLYPFDTEETDEEEIQVNAQIRVSENAVDPVERKRD
jgi:septin family protein